MIYRIEFTTLEDLDRIRQLNQNAIPAVNSLSKTDLLALFDDAHYFQNLYVDEMVVGFLIALAPGITYQSTNYLWFQEHYSHFLYVDRIVIDPSYQGLGFGRMLYDTLLESAKDQFTRITCEVNLRPRNDSSLIFHQKYGFDEVGVQETEGGKKKVSLMEYQISAFRN